MGVKKQQRVKATPVAESKRMRVFVSHATKDKPIATPFVDMLLKLGCEVPRHEIYFTSHPETGIPIGGFFVSDILENLKRAELVVCLLSEAYVSRPFCLAEVGAAQLKENIKAKSLFPLIIPPFAHKDLDGIVFGAQVGTISDVGALDLLRDRVVSSHIGPQPSTAAWNRHSKEFLDKIAPLLKPPPVPLQIKANAAPAIDPPQPEPKSKPPDANDYLKYKIPMIDGYLGEYRTPGRNFPLVYWVEFRNDTGAAIDICFREWRRDAYTPEGYKGVNPIELSVGGKWGVKITPTTEKLIVDDGQVFRVGLAFVADHCTADDIANAAKSKKLGQLELWVGRGEGDKRVRYQQL